MNLPLLSVIVIKVDAAESAIAGPVTASIRSRNVSFPSAIESSVAETVTTAIMSPPVWNTFSIDKSGVKSDSLAEHTEDK